MIITLALKFLQHFTYVALILILCAAGMGVPIPEDIPLITSGWLCNKVESPLAAIPNTVDTDGDGTPDQPALNAKPPRHVPHLYLMMIAGMIGVLGGDTSIYFIGRRGVHGKHFVARHLRKVLNSKRRQRVESHFIKHGNLTVFVARFLPGVRSIVFAMAGISRMSYARFLLIDGLAAAISVPTFIYVGWRFAAHINGIIHWIDSVKHILTPIAVAVMAMVVAIYLVRRRRNRVADPLQTTISP
jgi:membrane protein DedA with SNARE-associated domain